MSSARTRDLPVPRPAVPAASGSAVADPSDGAARSQLRGSSLLLIGRGVSLLATIVIQVSIVRYLTKAEYGAFAYALSIATLLAGLTTAGLDRAVPRFVPIYDESTTHPGAFVLCCHSGVTLCANHALSVAPMIARGALDTSLVAPFSARRFHVQAAG